MTYRGNEPDNPGTGRPMIPSGHLDDWAESIVDFLDGTAEPNISAAIEAHLATCPDCVVRLADQRSTASYLRGLPSVDAPEGLEDRILGELLFPSKVIHLPEPQESRWPTLWHRRLRAWVPAAAAVAAVLVGVVAFGLISSAGGDKDMTVSAPSSTVAAAPAAAMETASAPLEDPEGDTAFVGAAGGIDQPTTTAGAVGTETTTTTAVAVAGDAVTDRRAMVDALKSSAGPLFLTFRPTPTEPGEEGAGERPGPDGTDGTDPDTGRMITSASDRWIEEALNQLREFTQLEPLPAAFSEGDLVFAAYLNHDHVSAFVDLLRSIAASIRLDLMLQTEPDQDGGPSAARISEGASEVPLLLSRVLPQPSVNRYTFTTSTLPPAERSSTDFQLPHEAGTHVLTVLFIRR